MPTQSAEKAPEAPPAWLRAVDLVRTVGAMFVFMLAAVLRRSIGRRRRPTWSFGVEVLASGYQGFTRSLCRIGVVRFRYVAEAVMVVPNPLLKGGVEPRWVRLATEAGPLKAAWFEPPGADGPVIYYLHGGGFGFCSIATHREIIGALARASNARAYALEFRLPPEHPYPAPLDDILAGYRDLLAQGIPAKRIVLAGDSSGGNHALNLLLMLREAGDPLPAAAVAISPGTDLIWSGGSFQTNADSDYIHEEDLRLVNAEYLAGADPRGPYTSPLFADLAGLPPLLLQAGAAEVLVDQVRAFGERARAAGVDVQLSVYDDMVHAWHVLGRATPLAQQAIDEIGAFVREHAVGGEVLITLRCEALVTRGEDEVVTDTNVIASYAGRGDEAPGLVDHMDGTLGEIGLEDAGARFAWDGEHLWTELSFRAPRALNASELAELKDYLIGQLYDGWGTDPYEDGDTYVNWICVGAHGDATIRQVDDLAP